MKNKKMMRAAGPVLAAFVLANCAAAQTPVKYAPSYFVGSGVEYNRYNTAGPAVAGWTTFAIQVGQSKVYSWSTIELTSAASTARTGAAYLFAQVGNWSVVALGDAGLAVSPATILGSFSGGGGIFYDLGQRLNQGHFYLAGMMRVISISSSSVEPVLAFGVGKSF